MAGCLQAGLLTRCMAIGPFARSPLRLPILIVQDSGSEDLGLQTMQPTDAGTVSDFPEQVQGHRIPSSPRLMSGNRQAIRKELFSK